MRHDNASTWYSRNLRKRGWQQRAHTLLGVVRNASFQRQLTWAVTLGVFLLALLASLASSWQGGRQIRATSIEQGQRIADNLANQALLSLLYVSSENAGQAVNTTLAFPDVTGVEVRLASGVPLLVRGAAHSAPETPPELAHVEHAFLEAETPEAWRFVAPVLRRYEDTPFSIVERSDEVLGYVRVVQSKATLERMTRRVLLVNLGISLLFATLFLFVIRGLAKRLIRPLNQLSDAMLRAEYGEAHVRAPVAGPADIADMARAFNRMIAALQEREQALRESQARYREVVESVKEVIFQTDANGCWALLNPAWREISGQRVEACLGRPLLEYLHPEDRALVSEHQARIASGELTTCRYEARILRADGSAAWVEAAQRVRFDTEGTFAGTSGTLDDIT